MGRARSGDMAAFLNALLSQCLEWRSAFTGESYVNLALMAGKHDIYWDEDSHQVVEIPRSRISDVRINMPRIPGICSQIISYIIEGLSVPVCLPETGSDGDRLAARSRQRLLEAVWQRERGERLLREVVLPSMLCSGVGFLSPRWDPDAGNSRTLRVAVEQDEDQEGSDNLLQLFGAETGREIEVPEGDVVLRAYTDNQVIFDPFASMSYKDAQYAIEFSYVPLQDVAERYNVRASKLVADHDGTHEGQPLWQQKIMSGLRQAGDLIYSFGRSVGLTKSKSRYVRGLGLFGAQEVVLQKILWTAPSDKYPEGRKIVVVNDSWVNAGASDNPYRRIPFIPVFGMPIPGSLEKIPLVSLMRGLQTMENALWSQFVQAITLYGHPQWLVEYRNIVDPSYFNSDPDATIYWQINPMAPGIAPKRLDAPHLGTFFGEAMHHLQRSWGEVSGLRDVSMGRNPAGVRSARALENLKESDEAGRIPLQRGVDDAMQDVSEAVLDICARFYREDRSVAYAGPSGQAIAFEVSQTDVKKGKGVRLVSAYGGLPQSWGARAQIALEVLAAGAIRLDDERERREFLRLLEFGRLTDLWDDGEEREVERIHYENLRMLVMDGTAQVQYLDLHKQHLEQHRRFMRSADFETAISRMEPQQAMMVMELFKRHTDEHANWVAVEEGGQPVLEEGEEAPVAPGGPGVTSAPMPAAMGAPPAGAQVS